MDAESTLKIFEGLTSSPEIFLDPAFAEAKGFKNVSKKLHQNAIEANSLLGLKSKSLKELLVDGFDEEQIWQQIELQNKSASLHYLNNLSKFESQNPDFNLSTVNASMQNESLDQDDLSDEGSLSDDYQDPLSDDANHFKAGESDDAVDLDDQDQQFDEDGGSDEDSGSDEDMEIKKPKSILKKPSEELDDKPDDLDAPGKLDEKSDDDINPPEKHYKKRKHESIVDDRFFKLKELEQFLKIGDLKEERARDGDLNEDKESGDDEDEDEDLSDDDIDYFQDIPSDEDEDEFEDGKISSKKHTRELHYKDFYDDPDSEDKKVNENETSDQDQSDDLSDTEMDLSNVNEDPEDDENLQTQQKPVEDSSLTSKTPFQLEQEKVKQQIEDYEEKMLKPAAWHLTGEVDSCNRPIDALLHLQTDFEMNAKPVVIQDKPLCEKLESMLKSTIKNKAFSDGVKQYKTNDEIIAKKKEIVVEQTKSKKSLAQEYEDMYLKKKHGEEAEENPKHKEIKKLMDSLFPELHALFSHIPKPAVPEIKIVSNLPAISVEEVAPTSVSDVTLLAPEEVKKRTGIIKGQTERTDTDRKRERRKKKFHQKVKQKKREKESADKPLSAKAQKQEKLDLIRKLKQQRNTKFAKTDGQKIKSSKDFFERLQDTVSSTVSKIKAKKKKS